MPHTLDGGDRKLLIAAGVLLGVLLVAASLIAPPQVAGTSSIPSSYSQAWNGTKAAFLLLQDLGYNVQRWERSPLEIDGDRKNEVVILAEPRESPSEDERVAIRDFLANGGRLLVTGASASQFVPEASTFSEGDPTAGNTTFSAVALSPIEQDAPQISMPAPDSWHPVSPRELIVYGNEDTAAVVTYRFGKGQVIWWASAEPLTNGGIRESGNLALFLNSVGPPGARILWDEYFHGVHGSLLSLFAHTPIMWASIQLGLMFVLVLATYSRRLGPIRPPATPSRLSPLEFVETLGDLYNSAHAGSAGVSIAEQHFRFAVTRKLGLSMHASISELATCASQNLGWEYTPLFETLNRCEVAQQGGGLRDDEAVELVQQLFDFSKRLEVRRATGKGTPREQSE
jgi:Domain of unknown function (DUF4350)